MAPFAVRWLPLGGLAPVVYPIAGGEGTSGAAAGELTFARNEKFGTS